MRSRDRALIRNAAAILAAFVAGAHVHPLAAQQAPTAEAAAPAGADTAAAARTGPGEPVRGPGSADLPSREAGFDVGLIDVEAESGRAAATLFTELLSARAGGASVQRASGLIGMGSRVRLRGVNSLFLGNNPLLYVDGVRVSNRTDLEGISTGGPSTSEFERLNPEEIASIQILRGPAATNLYGLDATGGVILVETRRGSADQDRVRVTLRTTQGLAADNHDYPDNFGDLTTHYGITDPDDPRLEPFQTVQNPVTGAVFVVDNPLLDPDTRPLRRGHHQTYGATASGAEGPVAFFGSLQYQDLQGTLRPNKLQRLHSRINLDAAYRDLVRLELSGGWIRSDLSFPDDNNSAIGHAPAALGGNPLHSFGTDPVGGPGAGPCLSDVFTENGTRPCDLLRGNRLARFGIMEAVEQREDGTRSTGSARIRVTPVEWLTLHVLGGRDASTRELLDLFPLLPDVPVPPFDEGFIVESRQEDAVTTRELGAAADFELTPRLRAKTSLGYQRFATRRKGETCQGRLLSPNLEQTCSSAIVVAGSSWHHEGRESGIFLRQGLGYRDAIFGSVSLRGDRHGATDGSRIWSPGIHVSALVSEMTSLPLDALDALALRLAWGESSRVPPFLGAEGIRPERTGELEAGFDAELLDGRLGVAFTSFNARTRDLLVPRQVQPGTGFGQPSLESAGTLSNRGLELSLDARLVDRPDLAWDVRLLAATQNPIVDDVGATPVLFGLSGAMQTFRSGLPPGAYVGPVVGSATRDAEGRITSYEFLPGNVEDGSDLRYLGNPNVRNEQALSTVLTLPAGFRIFTLFDRKGDHQVLNATRFFRTIQATIGVSEEWAFREERVSPETQAMMELGLAAPFVEDAAFVKWRELTITYDVPAGMARRAGASRASLMVGGRNLRTFTSYGGLDPELDAFGGRDVLARADMLGIGIPQTWFATLRVGF